MNRFWAGSDGRTVAALAAVAVAAVLYMIAAGPLDRAVRDRSARVERLERDIVWMRDVARRIRDTGPAGSAVKGSLLAFADQTLQQAGISSAVERIAAENTDSVRVWFGEVEFARLAGWLAKVSEAGVRVSECRLDGRDRGQVKGEVRLKRP